ncbi:hypothetical protein ND748_28040 [Frankia sp. AiPs1]|uniref:hypothetical protein n=1 Tax=Frankia sp. AiPs1 TaxID=573493 RepID=UPI002043DD23|nr:hypothetical protein [Frankia sp. AiPs1]MCM3925506.1 hypothetical protein [Frankia sp. AiPs1]
MRTYRTLVHVVGEADINVRQPAGRSQHKSPETLAAEATSNLARLEHLTGDDRGAFFAANPTGALARHLRTLVPRPRVILLATNGGDHRDTMPIAEKVAAYLGDAVTLADRPRVIPLLEPTVTQARSGLAAALDDLTPAELAEAADWTVLLGSGATGILLGVLYELLVRGRRVLLRAADADGREISPYHDVTVDDLRRWLVRHRYYGALAQLVGDADGAPWQRLHERQSIDVRALLRDYPTVPKKAGDPTSLQVWPFAGTADDPEPRTPLEVLRRAVESSFFGGLARGEVTDGAAARIWFSDLVDALTEPRAGEPASAADGRRAKARRMLGFPREDRLPLAPDDVTTPDDPLYALLTEDVVEWYRGIVSASHGGLHAVTYLPAQIRARAQLWVDEEHASAPLADFPAWPVLDPPPAQRRVLLLRVRRSAASRLVADDQRVLDRGRAELRCRESILVEFAGPEVPDADDIDGVRYRRVPTGGDARTIEYIQPSTVVDYAEKMFRAIAADRDDPAGIEADLVDEVAVLLPLGFKALAIGAMLAAVRWSIHLGVPLRVIELPLDREPATLPAPPPIGSRPDDSQPTEAGRPLAALGQDRLLARLASTALGDLDLGLAHDLARRGSSRLTHLAAGIASLQRDFNGIVDLAPGEHGTTTHTSPAEIAFAVARLRLCRTIVDRHPWDAAYLAASILDHTFRMPPCRHNGDTCDVPGIGRVVLSGRLGWVPVAAAPTRPSGRLQQWPTLAPWEGMRTSDDKPSGMPPDVRGSGRTGGATRPEVVLGGLQRHRNKHPLSHGIDERQDPKPTDIRARSTAEIAPIFEFVEEELTRQLNKAYPGLTLVDADDLTRRLTGLVALATELSDATRPPA